MPITGSWYCCFLQFASNNSTLKPESLEGKRFAISKYYRDKGYSDECLLDADERIVGNPTRHVSVKSFLDGTKVISGVEMKEKMSVASHY